MLRPMRRSPWTRITACCLLVTVPWIFGPGQAAEAAGRIARAAAARDAGTGRRLSVEEARVIRGRATWPGGTRPWQYGVPALGGYGEINCISTNLHIAIPVLGYSGKGVPTGFSLHFNSAATAQSFMPMARPPISNGWTHSYNIFLEGAGTSSVTVVEGDGSRNTFTLNMDASYTAPAGVFDTLIRNGDLTYRLTRKHGLKLNFGSNNKLASLVDLNSNTTAVAYGGNGQISTITDAAGRVLSLSYLSDGRLQTITDPASRQFSLSFDGNYNLQRITFPAPVTGQAQPYYEFVSDAMQGTVTSFRNRRGATWAIEWGTGDPQRFYRAQDPNLNWRTLAPNYNIIQFETGTDYQWTTDASGNRASVTIPADPHHPTETQSWTWDAQRNMTSRTTGRGNVWDYTHDSKGNVLTEEDPVTRTDANVTKWVHTYNSVSMPTSRTNALGQRWDSYYDGTGGNLIREVDPLLYERNHTYSTAGQKLTTTDERAKVWRWSYDAYGHQTEAKDPYLNTTTTVSSVLGWPSSVTLPTGQQTTFTHDNLGRRTRVTHPSDGSYVESTYDGEDALLTIRDENARVTTRVVNLLGWVTSITDAKNQATSFGFNAVGDRTSLTSARSKTTTWTRDNGGRVVRTDYPDATSEQVTYNADGDVASTIDGRNFTVSRAYDTVGRLTDITYPTGTNTVTQYRADDKPTQMTDRSGTTLWSYNARGETTQVNAPQGTVTSGFAPNGVRSSVTRGAGTTSYTLDDASRVTGITNGFSETSTFVLDGAGRILEQYHANGTKTLMGYHAGRGWMTAMEHRKSDNTVLARYEYTRDLTGRLTQSSQPGDHTVAYTNDEIYQLTREVRTGTNPYDISYSYDASGNRLTKTSGAGTETSTYGDNNQILTCGNKTYQHDANGNMTQVTSGGQTTTLAWDYNNKVTGITYPGGATNSFVTNDLGNRISKTDSGGTTSLLFDGNSVFADSRADYTHGGVRGLISERASGVTKTYHADQLGSTRGLTNSSQTVTDTREYDSFGLLIASSGTTATPFGFVGGEGYQRDNDSGLMLLGARYYDPSIGRFISRDPIGYAGGLNLYGYCENDPTNSVDPSGNGPWWWELIKAAYQAYKQRQAGFRIRAAQRRAAQLRRMMEARRTQPIPREGPPSGTRYEEPPQMFDRFGNPK